jgi:hypothetical protein
VVVVLLAKDHRVDIMTVTRRVSTCSPLFFPSLDHRRERTSSSTPACRRACCSAGFRRKGKDGAQAVVK